MDTSSIDESSSCESCISEDETTSREHADSNSRPKFLLKIADSSEELTKIKHLFYSHLGNITSASCPLEAVYKNMHTFGSSGTRLKAFQLCSEAMKKKRGISNVRHAWYSCSKHEVIQILRHGFESCSSLEHDKAHGLGAHLFPLAKPIDCLRSSVPDSNGLQYLLLCDVILGNMEEINPPSNQLCPSVDQFDSGVDNQDAPGKYIIWPGNVKTHICPLYVICVRSAFLLQNGRDPRTRRPTSPWIPFSRLFSVLAASLPPQNVCLIKRTHVAFMEGKITRCQLVSRVREITGDELLQFAIRIFGSKASQSTRLANFGERRRKLN